jgi:tetratricopeptide (TPR) repeat protein
MTLFFVTLILFVFEILLLVRIIQDTAANELIFLLHSIACAAPVILVFHSMRKKKDLCYPILLFLSTYAAGPFGLGGFLLVLASRPLYSRIFSSSELWFKELFPDKIQDSFSEISDRIDAGWDDFTKTSEVFSFQDLFSYGTMVQKQAVLDAIVKDFNPVYAKLLKQGLKDPINAIRIQAAAIIEKIDVKFDKKKVLLRKKWQKDKRKIEALQELAKHCDMYGTLGLLNEVEAYTVIDEAILYYEELLKKDPSDEKSSIAIAKLLLYQKKYQDFLDWLSDYKKNHAILPEILYTWELDALYRLHEHEKLNKNIDRVRG